MNHKYGFHVNRTGDDVLDAIKRIRPAAIKVLDPNVDFLKEVRDIIPDVFLIGRIVVSPSIQERFVDDPAGKARIFAERILRLEANRATYHGRRLFDAWESYNEVLPGGALAGLKRAYDDFQVAFAKPIKQAGFEPIAMNFGTGNMLGSDFLNHFPGTLETHTYLGFHEYDWPDMWRLHEKNIREKNEGGMWLTLRYRRIMSEVHQVYPDRHTAIITECGMTQGVHPGKDDVGPWHPSHPIAEERYWESLVWYNDELMKDDYIMAALLFVVGAIHPWESFEHLGDMINRLEQFQKGEPSKPEKPDLGASLHEKLLAAATKAQVIQFNPRAGLQKQIFADGFVPNSPEFEIEHGGVHYVAQRAEHLGTGEVRVYHVKKGDWARVAYIRRGEDSDIFRV